MSNAVNAQEQEAPEKNSSLPNGHAAEKQPSAALLLTLSVELNRRVDVLAGRNEAAIHVFQDKFATLMGEIMKLATLNKQLRTENTSLRRAQKPRENDVAGGDYSEFKSVYESFRCKRCEELNKKYNELIVTSQTQLSKRHAELLDAINTVRAGIKTNKTVIEGVWKQLHKTRGVASMVFEQNRMLKEAVTKERSVVLQSKAVGVHLVYLEVDVEKAKHKLVAEQIRKVGANSVVDFSDQPICDDDIVQLSSTLSSLKVRDMIKELVISNGYACNMEGVIDLIRQNSGVLRRLAINNTLMNIPAAIRILETIASEKVPLDELNLDNNQLEGDDLVLMIKPISMTTIKQLSVKGNPIHQRAIEKFCKATKGLQSLESVDVGRLSISEQKELEWRTEFTKLIFERINVHSIDYQYV